MKTSDLLATSEADLVPQLRSMKLKELERHAAKLLKRLGAEYASILAAVTRAVPELGQTDNAFAHIQAVVRQGTTSSDEAAERLIERAAVIMMVIIKKQFVKIHTQT